MVITIASGPTGIWSTDKEQLRRWAGWFDVTEELLVRAVKLVGPAVQSIAEILDPPRFRR
jgi:hypothetical protein